MQKDTPMDVVSDRRAKADSIRGVAINAIGRSQGGGFKPLQGCREPRQGQRSTPETCEDFGSKQTCETKRRRS